MSKYPVPVHLPKDITEAIENELLTQRKRISISFGENLHLQPENSTNDTICILKMLNDIIERLQINEDNNYTVINLESDDSEYEYTDTLCRIELYLIELETKAAIYDKIKERNEQAILDVVNNSKKKG